MILNSFEHDSSGKLSNGRFGCVGESRTILLFWIENYFEKLSGKCRLSEETSRLWSFCGLFLTQAQSASDQLAMSGDNRATWIFSMFFIRRSCRRREQLCGKFLRILILFPRIALIAILTVLVMMPTRTTTSKRKSASGCLTGCLISKRNSSTVLTWEEDVDI